MNTKKCNKCKTELPATTEYFSRNRKRKDGLVGTCKQCIKEYHMKRYLVKKDKIKKQNREYYEANKEKMTKIFVKNSRECYLRNIEKYTERNLKYGEENRDYYKEYHKEYSKNFPEKLEIIRQRRDARISNLPYELSKEQWEYIKLKFNNTCAYCGETLPLEKEHFIPVIKGGGYVIDNIVPSCRTCNAKKNTNDFSEWYPKQRFYSKEREDFLLNHLKYIKAEWNKLNKSA